jgi:glyoxylase-like metal-dependent hydrolase (beta-lactamase superfamily II)
MAADVVTIDCEYVFERFAAAYLLKSGRQAAFIDNNTAHCVPLLMKALDDEGLAPSDVQWIIITHVHLDHAGGTSKLAELCPNAQVLAHPRAAPHVIDPAKLVASARKVYGEEIFEKLYGEIKPIPQARVRVMQDGETVRLGTRELRFLHTRGHANHHFCIHSEDSIFTGDAFGLRYPAVQGQGLFVFPSTSPTDFDAAEARKSVDRIVETGARMAYPTHFGGFPELKEAAQQLKEHLDFSETLLNNAMKRIEKDPSQAATLGRWCSQELRTHYERWLATHHRSFGEKEWQLIEMDLQLNGDGIAFVAGRKLKERTS